MLHAIYNNVFYVTKDIKDIQIFIGVAVTTVKKITEKA